MEDDAPVSDDLLTYSSSSSASDRERRNAVLVRQRRLGIQMHWPMDVPRDNMHRRNDT